MNKITSVTIADSNSDFINSKFFKLKFSINSIFLIFLFYFSPFMDALSGYIILSGSLDAGSAGSVSQIFRFVILLLSLFIVLKDNKFFYIVILTFVYIVIFESFITFFHQSSYGYIIGLIYGSKILYLMLIFLALWIMYKNNELTFDKLLLFVRNTSLISTLLLIIPFFLNIGFHTYDEGTFGFKGFFAAGNGLGLYMGAGLMLTIYQWSRSKNLFSLFYILLIIFATVIIGSKAALAFSLTGLISVIFLLNNKYLFLFVLLSVIAFIYMFFDEIVIIFSTVFDHILFLYGDGGNFWSFILSSRDLFLSDAIDNLNVDGWYALRIIFGFGMYISFREPFSSYQFIDILESDFADLLFAYGIIAVSIYSAIILLTMYKAISRKKFFLLLIFCLYIGHSLFAGYAVFNAMAGTFLPIIIVLILMNKNSRKDSYE